MMDVKFEGDKELEKTLEHMADVVGDKKTGYILKDAARIVAKAVAREAPKGPTGNLKKAPYARQLPERFGYPPAAVASVSRRRAPHAHLVEAGTKPRYQKSGRFTGMMTPNPFFKRGWASTQQKVRAYIETRLVKAINKAMGR